MNARKEFEEHTAGVGQGIICANIKIDNDSENSIVATLKEGYSKEDYKQFLEKLDIEYDDGYGGQELFGLILYDRDFSTRWEYDGSEGWCLNRRPRIKEVTEMFKNEEEIENE